ncbi:MAG: hypothetical protein Q4B43_09920 [Bacteroidota bacterium]|nr:hypothetical protein [Bacteroidota bacterium]
MSNKIFNIKERILYFLDYKGITKSKFFEKIGMTYGNFTGKSKETPLNSDAVSNILLELPDLNSEWLLTGKGEMIKSSTQNISIEGQNKNLNNINGGSNINISQNDISEIIEIQREMNDIIKTAQSQLTESQKQITNLIEILKSK